MSPRRVHQAGVSKVVQVDQRHEDALAEAIRCPGFNGAELERKVHVPRTPDRSSELRHFRKRERKRWQLVLQADCQFEDRQGERCAHAWNDSEY